MGVPGWLVSCGGPSSSFIFLCSGSPPSGLGDSNFKSSRDIFNSSIDLISDASVTTCNFTGDFTGDLGSSVFFAFSEALAFRASISVFFAFSAALAASCDLIFC